MARTKVRIWYDKEADLLEVLFNSEAGTFEETANDRVMVRVNSKDQVTGFSVLGLTNLSEKYLDLILEAPQEPGQ